MKKITVDELIDVFSEKLAESNILANTGWDLAYVDLSEYSAKVVLSLENYPDYTLTIIYSKYRKKEEFSTNVAAYGTFELLESSAASLYYMAIGNLLSQKEKLSDLKEMMIEHKEKMSNLEKDD